MAQTKERTQPAAKTPPKAAQRPAAPAPKSSPAEVARSWLTRLRGPLTNAPNPNGQPRQRAGGTIFKSFFGILIWFVASQFIMYGLILLDSVLPRVNGLPMLESTHLLPPNTPLLGWITPFLLLYGGAVIGLWFLLIRLKLIPRDFFNARAQAQERARRQAAANGTTATGASTGPRKTRTQRRHAEAQAQANAKANTKGNGKAPAKPAAKPAPKPAAKPAAKAPAKPAASDAAVANDEAYEQVRAADRLRRRRVAKR